MGGRTAGVEATPGTPVVEGAEGTEGTTGSGNSKYFKNVFRLDMIKSQRKEARLSPEFHVLLFLHTDLYT